MKFLITGGAGFIGVALSNRLASQGHEVIALDDCSTGDPSQFTENVNFVQGNISDKTLLWTLLKDVDCVFHLAARVSVPESVLFPSGYNHVNVGGPLPDGSGTRYPG